MLNLIRNDFKRFRKDKSMVVMGCLVIFFTLMSTVLFKVIQSFAGDMEEIGLEYTAQDVLASALNPASNMGLIILIVLSIILVKDYTHGTIRNKIIIGKKKTNIYVSSWITLLVFAAVTYIIYAVLNWVVGVALFQGFGSISAGDVTDMIVTILLATVAYFAYASLFVFYANTFRTAGITIAAGFATMVIFSILSVVDQIPGLPESVTNINKIIPTYWVMSICNDGITTTNIIGCFAVFAAYSGLTLFVGTSLIKSKDIK